MDNGKKHKKNKHPSILKKKKCYYINSGSGENKIN